MIIEIKNRKYHILKTIFFSIFFCCLTSIAFAQYVKMVPESFADIVEKAGPAVVNIRTVKTIKGGGPVYKQFFSPFGEEHPMDDIFKKFFGEEQQKEYKRNSLGSGFIIDKEGYIITNNHVIKDADDIKVKIKDGEEFEAKIIGRDTETDIALIKIESNRNNFYSVNLGDSSKLKVGEWVVAIGSPFGLEQTVTAGIVSAKGRVIGSGAYDNFIQTDASINFGNSGGPLINMNGEVIGINTAIIYQGQGIGFAIPINMAKEIAEQLKLHGEYKRGWIGVKVQDITKDMADYYNLTDKNGVFIADTFKGDPADKAGIKPKDIIVEINGEKINNTHELLRIIAGIKVGTSAKITVLRDGGTKTFNIDIAERNLEKKENVISNNDSKKYSDDLGLTVSDITPEIAEQFGIDQNKGVIVIDTESDKKGEKAGLQKGDIITEINRINVHSLKDYTNIIKKIGKGETIRMFIERKREGFLVIKIVK